MPERTTQQSVCALDCPDACSVLVHIEDGKAVRLEGNPAHPITRGFLCGKVARYLDRQYHPERLLYPMKRTGPKGAGQFARISWDEALTTIAERLQHVSDAHGPEAILPYSYGGNMGYLNGSGMDRRFFHRLGASRLDRTICASAGTAALTESLGSRCGTEPEQFVHSKLILSWGASVHSNNIHLWPFIVEARRRGARLITIDPIRTRTASLADQHIYIHPGSDLALALGLMHVIIGEGLTDQAYLRDHTIGFSELAALAKRYPPAEVATLTGIPADQIVALARDYATTRPAVIRAAYGLQRSERGGRAVQAISCLPALTGSWRDVGGGFVLSTSGGFQVNRIALERPDLQRHSPLKRESRLLNMTEIGRVLTEVKDPPVQAVVVYNSNPVAIAPNTNLVRQGFGRPDLFTVVIEQFQTDTADWADLILPATTFLENTDLYFAYGHYYLQMSRPALPAPGECKSNFRIFRELAEKMGLTDQALHETEDDVIRQTLNSEHTFLQGLKFENLDRERSLRLNVSPPGEPFLAHAEGNFGTPSGKCEFKASTLEYTPPTESRRGDRTLRFRFPLELVSSKNHDSMNSTFGNRPDVDAQTDRAYLHPEDAHDRAIAEGDLVRVFNERGSLRIPASVTEGIHRGVIRIPAVRWNKMAQDGQSVNVLTPDRLTDIGGGAVFYSCLVEVEKCGD